MPLEIVRNDITKMSVDVIVNAANTGLQKGGGVCGAIFAAAGAEWLQAECDRIGTCAVGEAVITGGYNLPAKFIIHTAGPVWKGGNSGEERLLHNCYANSLALAVVNGCESIAIPLISSGIYGVPKELALQIAVSAIGEFLQDHELTVYLTVYDKQAVVLSEKLFSDIAQYVDDNYVEEHMQFDRNRIITENNYQTYVIQDKSMLSAPSAPGPAGKRSLKDVVGQLDESFSQRLLRLIDEKGLTDVETYKRANIDRKLFSKIRSGKSHNPSKSTAIAFAIALRLSFDEARDLLGAAGYILSSSSKFDVIIAYFIEEGTYNIHEINEALFVFAQPLLGA